MASKEKQREYQARYKAKPGMKEKYAQLNKAWIANNRQQYNKAKSLYRFKLKLYVLQLYSGPIPQCASCGYSANIDALCLDHIANDGAAHRAELGVSSRSKTNGTTIYERIKAHGKMDGLQVLCANCNTIKELERKRNGLPSFAMLGLATVPNRWC